MHRAVLLYLAVLVGCASGPPERSEYHRGTFTPPPPAPVRPGVGLPTYDPHVKPLPPQPQPKPGRLLPQTPETRREPGIWASNSASAWPQVLGVQLPGPEHPSETEKAPAAMCAIFINQRIDNFGLRTELDALALEEKRCFVGRAYHECASRHSAEVSRDDRRSAAFKAAFLHASVFAEDMKKRACMKGNTPEVQRLSLVFEGT